MCVCLPHEYLVLVEPEEGFGFPKLESRMVINSYMGARNQILVCKNNRQYSCPLSQLYRSQQRELGETSTVIQRRKRAKDPA